MKITLRRISLALKLCLVFSLGAAAGCEDKGTQNPEDGDKKSGNLCTEYKTCNECIAGQQVKGVSQGEAETQCGAAVVGCFVTWEKPITCGEKKADAES